MAREMKIGNKLVGDGHPTYVIAEIGINHNGDLDIAKQMIDAAVHAGVDAVKFQKRTPEVCTPPKQQKQMRDTPWGYITYLDYRYKVEFGEDEPEVPFYANLAEVLDPSDLNRVGNDLMQLFDADKASRQDWEQMYAKGLDLLGLRMEERTKPFRGAAGATHPMLQEAIIQFQAQAFRELMPAGGPVRTQILGKETVDKFQQAARVQDFMNYQITTVMEEYTPEFDQLLYYTGYGGSTFKKVYYDAQQGRMVSRLCLADDVYIPYNGSSVVSQCPRLTHRIAMDSNEYRKRVLAGEYLDIQVDLEPTPADPSQIQAAIDKVVGVQPTDSAGEVFLLEMLVDNHHYPS